MSLAAAGPDPTRNRFDQADLLSAYRSPAPREPTPGQWVRRVHRRILRGPSRLGGSRRASRSPRRGRTDRLRATVRGLVDNDGITYSGWIIEAISHGSRCRRAGSMAHRRHPTGVRGIRLGHPGSRRGTAPRLLDAVLTDLYEDRRCVTSGVLPPSLLFGHPGYIRAARGIENPGRHQLFMHGCDLSRAADGRFLVNADRTQAPSGAGYALADRRVVGRAVPDLYERVSPHPASPFAQALRLALIEAAPAAPRTRLS